MSVQELYDQYVRLLPPEERRELVYLALRGLEPEAGLATVSSPAEAGSAQARPQRLWREIAGLGRDCMVVDDAQAWVSRTRRESDNRRELQG